ncbi:mevalonate kinase [Methanobacterium ferruginis]|uniref:mevalonate kinase n=1 Tax=Methanobacterium ferruginis TaxID=710191 RepID=UPI002573FA53|nr:mevalonate kinase [Methanobacterium ferruginis]BDZ69038.1 mevalonate kinase [Methanobacterium ferruginis]
MKARASAPGKAILFGEHAVVYGKPAIAVAVNRKAIVTIQESTEDDIKVKIPELEVYGLIDLVKGTISPKDENFSDVTPTYNTGILDYIQHALFSDEFNLDHGLDINVDLEIPIGAGLGSSAAITVATLAATFNYAQQELTLEKLAQMAHKVELKVQGSASPLDTTISTYGGFSYFTHKQGAIKLETNMEMPLVVGYTSKPGNTGKVVANVRKLSENHPTIINPILDTMETVTNQAREAILTGEEKKIGELMNINQGLLDSLGVNTLELSNLVYEARNAGAIGSKITGAGGGGSIIAYCPGRTQEVLEKLQSVENAFPITISSEGVTW